MADIICWSVLDMSDELALFIQIIETKKGNADFAAVHQLCRYMKAVELNLDQYQRDLQIKAKSTIIHGALFCEDVCNRQDFGYLLSQTPNIFVYRYKVTLEEGLITYRWPGWVRRGREKKLFNKSIIQKDQLSESIKTVKSANRDKNIHYDNLHHLFVLKL